MSHHSQRNSQVSPNSDVRKMRGINGPTRQASQRVDGHSSSGIDEDDLQNQKDLEQEFFSAIPLNLDDHNLWVKRESNNSEY